MVTPYISEHGVADLSAAAMELAQAPQGELSRHFIRIMNARTYETMCCESHVPRICCLSGSPMLRMKFLNELCHRSVADPQFCGDLANGPTLPSEPLEWPAEPKPAQQAKAGGRCRI